WRSGCAIPSRTTRPAGCSTPRRSSCASSSCRFLVQAHATGTTGDCLYGVLKPPAEGESRLLSVAIVKASLIHLRQRRLPKATLLNRGSTMTFLDQAVNEQGFGTGGSGSAPSVDTVRQWLTVDQSVRKVPFNLRQSGRTPAEMLIPTRVRKSPYWHLSHEAGCWRATVYNRIYHPRGYVRPEDGGAMVEYEALVNHVTMWNVAVERQIRVKGPDAEAFVNYVITRDATRIKPMHGKYVILCNEAGGVLNDPVLLRISEDEFWFSLSDSDIEWWLRGVNTGHCFKVSIGEIDVCPVQIQGPKSEALMVDLFGDA